MKHISNEIMVMYLGKVVEYARTDDLFQAQYHPYTKALLSAVPIPAIGGKKDQILLEGELSSPIDPPACCRFAARCLYADDTCRSKEPELREVAPQHFVACDKMFAKE